MNNTVKIKYVEEFNLRTRIDIEGLSPRQIEALKGRMAAANISVAFDSAERQVRLKAATEDFDAAVDCAIKLEQSGAKYDVKSDSKSGGVNTSIAMSSGGDANYRGCLLTIAIVLAIVGFIVYSACKTNAGSSRCSPRSYQKSCVKPYRSSQSYNYPVLRKN